MDKYMGIISKRLENKRAELKLKQEYFNVMCHNEMDSKTFERNAINDLLVMQQLKSEIAELEHFEMMNRMQNGVWFYMITGDRELCWKYRDLILKQIKGELNPTEEELQLMRDRLNKASSDELERTYEAFERFGVEVIMETVRK